MNYRIVLGCILSLLIVSTVIGAFPLQQLEKGDTVSIQKFKGLNKELSGIDKNSETKLLLLWRHDKRTNVDTIKSFAEMCSKRDVPCIAVDLQEGTMEQIKSIVGADAAEDIYFAHDKTGVTDDWGIFTLPVTLFLDKNNKVINAVGYEGQYAVQVGRYVDFLTGKISEEEYKKFENTSVVHDRRSRLPKINFIKRLIEDGQPEDAKERLAKLDKKDLTMEEKLNLAEVYLKLDMPDKVEEALQGVSEYNVGAKFYRAYAAYLKGNLDKALKTLHSIEKIYPQKKKLFYLLGEIYKQKGDYKNAAEYFEKSCNNSAI
ncbi:tetratricopeptide repeat protein [Flexistipes sp.]|uniref:tetratricopeptide repeat protein n=1 Tax=Flexistipes sp. TaxID=3088135 RepID=UPI002E213999|nr:tetratricopeptide repeat protein [Flexistipes sp.]